MQVCDKCHSFKVFGKKCWFYWDGKKTCTQFRKDDFSEPEFKSVEL